MHYMTVTHGTLSTIDEAILQWNNGLPKAFLKAIQLFSSDQINIKKHQEIFQD